MSQVIKLKSSDGVVIATTAKAACLSLILAQKLTELKNKADYEIQVGVKGATLSRVVEWMEYHKNDEKQPSMKEIYLKPAAEVGEWDEQFLEMGLLELYELINAAGALSIAGLLSKAARFVAFQMADKTVEEIRHHFQIENNWNEEELKDVILENQWCSEK